MPHGDINREVYTQTIEPLQPPLILRDVKDQLRVDIDDEDAHITSLIETATSEAQSRNAIQIIDSTYTLELDWFPGDSMPIRFDINPVDSITKIEYIDENGDAQTWANNLYELKKGRKAELRPINGETYPSTDEAYNVVTITFIAGFGLSPKDVPSGLRNALMMMVAHYFDFRHHVSVKPGEAEEVPYPKAINKALDLFSRREFR